MNLVKENIFLCQAKTSTVCQMDGIKYHPALCAKCDHNRVSVWARRVGIIQESSGKGV